MANANPVLKGYPSPAPSCSSKRHFIAGIQTTVYGLDELARRPQSRKAACIWLLHGRLGRQENMQPMAHSVIHAWSRYLDTHDGKDVVGLIAITFDQRNHDSRTVDVSANADWKGGNPGHGVDMFSIYQGTVSDLSQLMDYVEASIFPDSSYEINRHIVCGISLGGHATWQSLFREERVRAAISVIGCPNYVHLMQDRAKISETPEWRDKDWFGSTQFPNGLIEAVRKHDPVGMITRDLCKPAEISTFFNKSQHPETNKIMRARLTEALQGKTFLNMSGADDQLVPYRTSQGFVEWLSSTLATPESTINFKFQNKIYEGVGHAISPNMAKDIDQFVVGFLSDLKQGTDHLVPKM